MESNMELILLAIILGGVGVAIVSWKAIHWAARRPANGEIKKVERLDRHIQATARAMAHRAMDAAHRF